MKLLYVIACPMCGSKDIKYSAKVDYCGSCDYNLEEYP